MLSLLWVLGAVIDILRGVTTMISMISNICMVTML